MTFGECFATIAGMTSGSIKVEVQCWRHGHLPEPVVTWEVWIADRAEFLYAPTPELLVERVADALRSTAPSSAMRPDQVQV